RLPAAWGRILQQFRNNVSGRLLPPVGDLTRNRRAAAQTTLVIRNAQEAVIEYLGEAAKFCRHVPAKVRSCFAQRSNQATVVQVGSCAHSGLPASCRSSFTLTGMANPQIFPALHPQRMHYVERMLHNWGEAR